MRGEPSKVRSLGLHTVGIITAAEKLEAPTRVHAHVLVMSAALHSDANSSEESVTASSPLLPGKIGPGCQTALTGNT